MSDTNYDRIKEALDVLIRYGGTDGSHHKAWTIDQAVRCLTGCPRENKTAIDCHGKEYNYSPLGKSQEYIDLIKETCDGEDGPNTYEWDEGIAP